MQDQLRKLPGKLFLQCLLAMCFDVYLLSAIFVFLFLYMSQATKFMVFVLYLAIGGLAIPGLAYWLSLRLKKVTDGLIRGLESPDDTKIAASSAREVTLFARQIAIGVSVVTIGGFMFGCVLLSYFTDIYIRELHKVFLIGLAVNFLNCCTLLILYWSNIQPTLLYVVKKTVRPEQYLAGSIRKRLTTVLGIMLCALSLFVGIWIDSYRTSFGVLMAYNQGQEICDSATSQSLQAPGFIKRIENLTVGQGALLLSPNDQVLQRWGRLDFDDTTLLDAVIAAAKEQAEGKVFLESELLALSFATLDSGQKLLFARRATEVPGQQGELLTLAMVFLIGLAAALVFGWLIGNAFAKPVSQLAQRVQQGFADKSFERGVEIAATDESGLVAHNVNILFLSLSRYLKGLQLAIETASSSVNDYSEFSLELEASSAEQSSSLSQIGSTMEEIETISRDVMQTATQIQSAVEDHIQLANHTSKTMATSFGSIKSVDEQMQHISDQVITLSTNAEMIEEIINNIVAISSQSSLLAVNAAIEASKAGTSGKGFSVVAAEVKNLAGQSREAADTARHRLLQIMEGVAHTRKVVATGREASAQSLVAAEDSKMAVQKMVEAVVIIETASKKIAASSVDQSAGYGEILQAVGSLGTVAEQIASGNTKMVEMLAELKRVIERLESTLEL